MQSLVDFTKSFLGCVDFKDINSYSLGTLNWVLYLTTALNHGWLPSKENCHICTTLNFLHGFVYRI